MPKPVDSESEFKIEELFFSTTDPRGIIQSGNEVFMRVSKYNAEELLEKPHNVIRHPDMPKTVFALFWQEIKAGRPISAYVKNMAKDGTYYWVFANAYQIKDGYVSIRLKPTSNFFEIVKPLYKKILDIEKKEGIEVGLRCLMQEISALGFPTYQSFMTKALTAELESRAKQLTDKKPQFEIQNLSKKIGDVFNRGKKFEQDFKTMSDNLVSILTNISTIQSASGKLSTFFKDLHFMGINLLAAIERLGTNGSALAQIVIGISDLGNELKGELSSVQEKMKSVMLEVESAEFQIQTCRIQAEMTKAFVEEILTNEASAEEKLKHCLMLFELTLNSIPSVLSAVESFSSVMRSFQGSLQTFLQLSSGMEFIRLSSKMESARLPQAGGGAVNHFNDSLGALISNIRTALGEMASHSSAAFQSIKEIHYSLESKNSERSRQSA